MHTRRSQHDRKLWEGMAAGLVAGAAASWVMEQFQAAWSKWLVSRAQARGENSSPPERQQSSRGDQDPATVQAAAAISERVFHHPLTSREKRIAGEAVHYAFGATIGGLYGAVAGVKPNIAKAAGLPFGAALWLAADEAAVPALGLSKSPRQYHASTHLYALASHLVYGLTTEVLRRAVGRILTQSTTT